jgi:flagellar biogenesis protein FliO
VLKRRLLVCVLGLIAVVAGLVLPQLWKPGAALPETVPDAKQEAKTAPDEPPAKYVDSARPEVPDLGPMVARLCGGTVVVLVFCVGTLWVSKRWLGAGMPAGKSTTGRLQMIESLSLGNRCVVYLLKADAQTVLAGVDSGGLKTLLPLAEPFEAALSDLQRPEFPTEQSDPDMIVPIGKRST